MATAEFDADDFYKNHRKCARNTMAQNRAFMKAFEMIKAKQQF